MLEYFIVGDRTYKCYKQTSSAYYGIKTNCSHSTPCTIPAGGCGITSVAILATGYGVDITPPEVASRCKDTHDQYQLCSTLSSIIDRGCAWYSGSKSDVMNGIIEQLQRGEPTLVLTFHSSGYYEEGTYSPFTKNGHYMAILAISEDGEQVFISNPNGNHMDQTRWWDIDEVQNRFEGYMIIE